MNSEGFEINFSQEEAKYLRDRLDLYGSHIGGSLDGYKHKLAMRFILYNSIYDLIDKMKEANISEPIEEMITNGN